MRNPENRYAVGVYTTASPNPASQMIVGHVPRELSRLFWYFLQHYGEITCVITGSRRRSLLVQGGLELPCIYKFVGKKKQPYKETTQIIDEMTCVY